MYVKPKQAAEYYNVAENTLRTWANEGRITYYTTQGGHRRYLINRGKNDEDSNSTREFNRQKIIYTRVSSQKQKDDLKRQTEFLTEKYPGYQIISDIGSGINFHRTGFKKILEGVFRGRISEVVVAHKDRFSRFGYSLFEWIFTEHNAVLICDEEQNRDEKEELADDLMAIITTYSARYYGKRKYRREKYKLL
jgi:excisionase family DNA binding protein